MAVQAISISHLDYYNSLLNDLSPSTLSVTTILLVGVQSQLSQILLPRFALNSPQLHVALKKKKKKKLFTLTKWPTMDGHLPTTLPLLV